MVLSIRKMGSLLLEFWSRRDILYIPPRIYLSRSVLKWYNVKPRCAQASKASNKQFETARDVPAGASNKQKRIRVRYFVREQFLELRGCVLEPVRDEI